jgi:hypothetical protein
MNRTYSSDQPDVVEVAPGDHADATAYHAQRRRAATAERLDQAVMKKRPRTADTLTQIIRYHPERTSGAGTKHQYREKGSPILFLSERQSAAPPQPGYSTRGCSRNASSIAATPRRRRSSSDISIPIGGLLAVLKANFQSVNPTSEPANWLETIRIA